MTLPLRALIVSYAFPPVGGAGVQRVLKLAKYLPSQGVRPAVLTVENPSVPVWDESLERDVPPGIDILRAPTLEPSYGAKRAVWNAAADASSGLAARAKKRVAEIARRLLVPDPQVLWLPGSALALVRRLRSDEADDVVFISGPPFSQFLLAPLARLRPGTAVVLDYRDEWSTTQSVYEMGGSARAGAFLERALLRSAHAVTTATEEFRSELLARFDFLDPSRVFAIPNGYDPDDFPERQSEPPRDRFVLTYVGTVFRLTSARGLVAGLRRFHELNPELAGLLDVRFFGRIVETEASYFEGTESLAVFRLGYVEHAQALAELGASHAVLCILDDVAGADRIYPAKIFEIMYLGRPCLALAPDGALARLVRSHGLGEVVSPRDPNAIAAALARMVQEFRDHGYAGKTRGSARGGTTRFHRKHQASEFARVFRAAAALASDTQPHVTF